MPEAKKFYVIRIKQTIMEIPLTNTILREAKNEVELKEFVKEYFKDKLREHGILKQEKEFTFSNFKQKMELINWEEISEAEYHFIKNYA